MSKTELGQQQTTRRVHKRETDYAEGIFQGVQYTSQAKAIMAGAKSYAKMDWETIKVINKKFGLDITPLMLLEAKKEIILESIAKRNEMPKEFE